MTINMAPTTRAIIFVSRLGNASGVGEREKDEWLSATDYISSFCAKRKAPTGAEVRVVDARGPAALNPNPSTVGLLGSPFRKLGHTYPETPELSATG